MEERVRLEGEIEMFDNNCCVCKTSLLNAFRVHISYGNGPDGSFCSQDCMRTYMENPQNAMRWMDWRGESIRMWRWPEFVPEDVRPRCKKCNGLLTLCGREEDSTWQCGYCQTKENLAREGKTIDDVVKKLKGAFGDFQRTGGDPKSFDQLKEI